MSLLSLSELSFEYVSGPVLFENVSFSIDPADRVAIVGPNGSGKSTLLQLIAESPEPTRGRIVRQRNYARVPPDHFGPPRWEPYEAPALDVHDAAGEPSRSPNTAARTCCWCSIWGRNVRTACASCTRSGRTRTSGTVRTRSFWRSAARRLKQNSETLKQFGDLPARLLSDPDHTNARRFHSYDDFEDIELHSTILIDKKGRVYWARFGGDPFSDMAFLVKQVERMNELAGS